MDILKLLHGTNSGAFLILVLFFVIELEELIRYIIHRVKEAKCRKNQTCNDDKEPPRGRP